MQIWRRFLVTTLAGLSVAALTAPNAQAITGGERDDANRYDSVGILAFYDEGVRYRCTATLVTPTVVLTAGHCTIGTSGKLAINFNPVIAESAPSNLPVASDPGAGFEDADGDGQLTDPLGRVWYTGTAYTHPGYVEGAIKSTNDVGVVLLDQPLAGPVSSLAPIGTLDRIKTKDLHQTLFREVGYGTEVRQDDPAADDTNQGKNPVAESYPIVRRYADAPGQKVNGEVLQLNGNIFDKRGTGGSCFGDSGGPTYYPGEGAAKEQIVALVSFGYTNNCRFIDGQQRVDTAKIRNWLDPILATGKAPSESLN